VLQHVPHEGPAAIADWADEYGHDLSVTRVDLVGAPGPGDTWDLLVVLGGPMGVHDEIEFPWLAQEREFIEQALVRARGGSGTVLGICLGAQLIASVLGATVTSNDEVEIGWYPVRRTHEVVDAAALSAIRDGLDVLHWHGDTFGVPEGAVNILDSEACENQAFESSSGRIVGLQFHLEQTPASLPAMVAGNADELLEPGAYIQSEMRILSETASHEECRSTLYTMLDTIERSVR
jgi:GMP synthase-like glutamine amidotransferase